MSREAGKRGEMPEAFYDYDTDRILILKAGGDFASVIGVLNHEFMHRVLARNRLRTAVEKWDSNFIGETEAWLGWWKPLPFQCWAGRTCRMIKRAVG